jgi:hypothetical protein
MSDSEYRSIFRQVRPEWGSHIFRVHQREGGHECAAIHSDLLQSNALDRLRLVEGEFDPIDAARARVVAAPTASSHRIHRVLGCFRRSFHLRFFHTTRRQAQ